MTIDLRRPLCAEVCNVDVSAPISESAFVWDNRSTMHQALADFDQTQSRYMERTTVLGTPSGYVVVNA